MESIMCHICNMYVPKQFSREHNTSLRHQIYLEIAKTALKRMVKHIHDENNNEEREVNESIHFCSDCVSVVNMKEKNNHENSLNHINSVLIEKRLSEFLHLYSSGIEKADNDPDDVNYEWDEILTSGAVQCIVCPEIVNHEVLVAHMMKEEHMDRVSRPLQDIHCKREIPPFWHNCVLCNIIITNYNFYTISDEVHRKLLKEALRSDDAKSLDNSTVSSENDSLVSNNKSNQSDVTAKEFMNIKSNNNYIFKIENGRLWCMVCNVGLNEIDSFESHIHLDDHINKYKELLSTNKLQIQYNNDFFCRVCKEFVVTQN